MITATKTWYSEEGVKLQTPVQLHTADHAFDLAHHVFKIKDDAYCITMDQFANGSFVTRVMSKEKMIFKIQYSKS